MKTSSEWIEHFTQNLTKQRIDWKQKPLITECEKEDIIRSLQAWQLGETSEGNNLIRAASMYAERFKDDQYVDAICLFIKEEQKHGENLGKYLDLIGVKRLKKDLGDTLFRKVRYLNTSMEIWTVTVIIVESFAQLYYQAIADATSCKLLKQICDDILIDEAHHIHFQLERLCIITSARSAVTNQILFSVYRLFFHGVFVAIWMGHSKAFKAGGISFKTLYQNASTKFNFIVDRLIALQQNYQKIQSGIA